ncbi:unnamed protein product [Ectocarpus sp. 12 AP-2014]
MHLSQKSGSGHVPRHVFPSKIRPAKNWVHMDLDLDEC